MSPANEKYIGNSKYFAFATADLLSYKIYWNSLKSRYTAKNCQNCQENCTENEAFPSRTFY